MSGTDTAYARDSAHWRHANTARVDWGLRYRPTRVLCPPRLRCCQTWRSARCMWSSSPSGSTAPIVLGVCYAVSGTERAASTADTGRYRGSVLARER
eukprot:604860-Rhodomonas_salina.1